MAAVVRYTKDKTDQLLAEKLSIAQAAEVYASRTDEAGVDFGGPLRIKGVPVLTGGLPTPNVQTGASYTLAAVDADRFVRMGSASANSLVVPSDAAVAALGVGTSIILTQAGTGAVTITPGTGVTLQWFNGAPGTGSVNLAGQFAEAVLTKIAANTWQVSGALGASVTATSLYNQTFGVDIGGWTAETNASNLLRDTTRDTQGALRWTATAAGNSRCKSPHITGVAPNVDRAVTVNVGHNSSASRNFNVQFYELDTNGGYLGFLGSLSTTVPNTGLTSFSRVLRPASATTARVILLVEAEAMVAGDFIYLGDAKVD